MIATLKPKPEVEYPTSDGKPMAETELHWREIMELVYILDRLYKDRKDVYIAGNNFFYYKEGDPKACFAADAYVVFGVSKEKRDCYKLWEEGDHVPSIIFEFTSRSTRVEDTQKKRDVYANLGVPEYFLYDPYAEYLSPPLQGFRLVRGRYVPLKPGEDERLTSESLKLKFGINIGGLLEVFDAKTNELLPRLAERERRVQEMIQLANERADRAEARSRNREFELAAENARLKAELERLKNK